MITIRPVQRGDIPSLWMLLRALAADQGLSQYVTSDKNKLAAALFHTASSLKAIVADQSGELVGYVTYYYGFSSFAAAPIQVIDNLMVTPVARGNGIGQRLMAAVAAECIDLGIDRIDLTITATNDRALRFYQRCGFVPADETLLQIRESGLYALARQA